MPGVSAGGALLQLNDARGENVPTKVRVRVIPNPVDLRLLRRFALASTLRQEAEERFTLRADAQQKCAALFDERGRTLNSGREDVPTYLASRRHKLRVLFALAPACCKNCSDPLGRSGLSHSSGQQSAKYLLSLDRSSLGSRRELREEPPLSGWQ
jgi:hypothetical protein